MKKRLLSILLAICMIVSLAPSVLAADADLTISDEDGLEAFAEAVNGGDDFAGKTVVLANSITLTGEWMPIGNGSRSGSGYTGSAFKGTFDGGDNTISGLTITSTTGADAALGLFGVVDGGTVKNLKLTDVNINVSDSECAGGAIGVLTGDGVADKITVSGSISAKRGNGGIVGRMLISGTISNCVNNAAMTATGGANLGGIVGAAYYTAVGQTMTISGCTNNGTITGNAGGVGGIVGLSAANVSNCTNTAAVSAKGASVGGIVGEQQNYGSIIGCINSADVTVNADSGQYGTGGIVGWIRYSGSAENYPLKGVVSVKNNTNSGKVVGASDAGGIVGTVYHAAEVSGNTNTASSLTAANFAAGIVANFQFSDAYYGDPIPQQELNLQNNVSTTALENISASCKNLYVYDNSSGSQDGTIEENSGAWVAQIGNEKYATLQAAIDAANAETMTVLTDVVLTETLTIPAGKTVTLDLNGKTISYTTTASEADDMIVNKGNLTITDSSVDKVGKLSYVYTGDPDSSYSYDNATIQNEGVLTIESGTVENTTATMSHASYAINTNAGATLNVKGGKVLNLNGHAIRQVSFATATNTVNISGGYIEGTRAVQFQLPGGASASTAPEMILNITGGELKSNESTYNLAVYVYSNGQSAENANISVSGDAIINGNIALNSAATASMAKGAASVTGGTINGDYGIFSYADTDTNNAILITGGTFATNYSKMYAEDDGYAFEKNSDGSYGVAKSTAAHFETGAYAQNAPTKPRKSLNINVYDIYAEESLVVKVYSGETLLVTSTYREYDLDDQTTKRYPLTAERLSVNIVISGKEAGSWDNAWAVDPSTANIPTKFEVWVDGELKDTWTEADNNGSVFKDEAELAEYQSFMPIASVTDSEGKVTYFDSFADAFTAAQAGETITLFAPIVVNAGETLTLDKAVTITYTSNVPGEDMITNKGNLVIDGATLVYTNTDTTASNVTVSTISCEPGSTLEVKSGAVKNDSANNAASGIYAYAIDLVTNGNLGDVTATISGGEVISTNYMAIRQFVNGEVCKNTLTVTGGTIKGATRGINIQLKNNMAYTTISGGTIEGGDYSICFLTSSENISVTGGTFKGAVWYSGETGIISGGTFSDTSAEAYLADGYVLESYVDGEGNTVYGVEPVYTVTITITPADATVVVKDSENNEVTAESDGTYELVNGTYTYSVSKDGYTTKTGSFTVSGADQNITVDLSEIVYYTVTYTDGVDGKEIFADQSFTVEEGSATPSFVGTPYRAGYIFTGWSPAVSATVTADVIYTATWTYDYPDIVVPTTYAVTVEDSIGGEVVASAKYAAVGSTVKLTVNPDAGYELATLTVKAGNREITTTYQNGTYNFTMPSANVTVSATFKKIDTTCPGNWTCPMYGFTDLDMTAWYHDGVHFCIENDLMQGVGNNQFNPNGTTTRAMIVTILWRLEGSPVVNYAMDFEDVAADQWYTEAIRWAASEKIVEGYGDGKFGTNDAITREQMVTIMFRYAKYKGYDVSVGENTNILSYDDAFNVADWSIPAMQWACGEGLVKGIADGSKMNLAPQGNATRAQAAAILQRFIENVVND